MSEDRFKSFEEFWPFYVGEHHQPGNRLLHFVGSSAGLICLIVAFITGKQDVRTAGSLLAEIHFGSLLRAFVGFEIRLFRKAEHPRNQHSWKAAARGIVIPRSVIIVLARHSEAVFSTRQVILEFQKAL